MRLFGRQKLRQRLYESARIRNDNDIEQSCICGGLSFDVYPLGLIVCCSCGRKGLMSQDESVLPERHANSARIKRDSLMEVPDGRLERPWHVGNSV